MNRAAFLRLMLGTLVGGASAPMLFAKGIGPEGPPTGAGGADFDFWFTRLMYESGNWDVDQRMPSNLITSLLE